MGIIKTFIDDKVAEEDVRQLNRAKENLNNSMTKLNNISRELYPISFLLLLIHRKPSKLHLYPMSI